MVVEVYTLAVYLYRISYVSNSVRQNDICLHGSHRVGIVEHKLHFVCHAGLDEYIVCDLKFVIGPNSGSEQQHEPRHQQTLGFKYKIFHVSF